MKKLRIFISSPGDVAEERQKARQVVTRLQRYYGDRLALEAVLWEDLPLQADASFQQGIDCVLSTEDGIDIAIFILWSRLGSPLGGVIRNSDGLPYRSGTEREFDLMLAARTQSGGTRPHILAYVRKDDAAFHEKLRACSTSQLKELIEQRENAEKFMMERFCDGTGANVRAYHSYSAAVSFAERLKVHLRALLDAHIDAEASVARWTEPPYQGLEVFDVVHAPIFHGREEEVARVIGRLREREERDGCAFVAIIGASGSGKSSLVRAGVAASLLDWNLDDAIRQWRISLFVPSTVGSGEDGSLLLGLARALVVDAALPELRTQVADLADFASALLENPSSAVKLVLKPAFKSAERSAGGAVRLLLVLDQLEELHTDRQLTAEDRGRFLTAVDALARSGSVHVIATLRSDFYSSAQLDETFVRLKGDYGHFDLMPPGHGALRAMILEPAKLCGLRFDANDLTGRTLADDLLEDALRQPDALPLLEYTLRELYEQKSADRRLTYDAYTKMGNIFGAVAQRAETVFTALALEVQLAFDETLWSLVTVSLDAEPVRRRASLPGPGDTTPHATLLRSLIRERFLVADHVNGHATVSLAHEALLRSWPRVLQWLRVNQDLLRIRRWVEEAARLWREKDGHVDYLLAPGLQLVEAESLLARRPQTLESVTLRFINESLSEARNKARQREREVAFASDLERSNSLLQNFATVASHELQEPLRKILAFSERLETKHGVALDEIGRDYLHRIQSSGARMKSFIKDIMVHTRAGASDKIFEQVDCNAALNEALTNLSLSIEESGATITRDFLPSISADRTRLIQLFQNLVGNAVKFRNQEKPSVHISSQRGDNGWQFKVSDNGIGIDPKFHEQIFSMFQRLHARSEYPGHGIGLGVCKTIIDSHGGRLWVQSEPGRGSAFYFTIPDRPEINPS